MAKRKEQDTTEELESYPQDDLSYEAFKKHEESVPAMLERLKHNSALSRERIEDTLNFLAWQANNEFDFVRVRKHLSRLPDTRKKLKLLYEIKTEFEHRHPILQMVHDSLRDEIRTKGFANSCELEIRKFERLLALEQSEAQRESKDNKERRGKGGTQYQNLLALHYLLLYAHANCHNTEKAKFASFLTGYSENTFRQQWSNVHQKADESGQIWEKDMKIVRDYFEALGLSEAVKLINNDLDSEREKL